MIHSINIRTSLAAVAFIVPLSTLQAQETETLHLSGHGCDDMKSWEFFCTDGRNAGQWTSIGVPSFWELQGFGTYQYGYEYNKWNKNPSKAPIADEQGFYRHCFKLPKDWRGRKIEIVFEAVMTDADVRINGRPAGDVHKGGFSPFRFDITDKVVFGKKDNILEVKVSKESADADINLAERRCDYWNFGGIIRPVYIEVRPAVCIDRVAIDAGMNGLMRADCFVTGAGKKLALRTTIFGSDNKKVAEHTMDVDADSVRVEMACPGIKLWTAETPHLYTAEFSITDSKGRTVHCHRQRFGFRTVELRQGDGFFINSVRVKMKGANRHSFRPESGRTLSYKANLEDVLLMKSMNMNAVRLSHYPADKEFYDICDSLGLYVIDELTGWQHPQNTQTGRRLVRELVTRDVNHPSVVIWASGNEGGFNYELEADFRRYDIQKRIVIYPWSIHGGMNTRHYRSWDEMRKYLKGSDVVMPTEFLHGLYDGGLGAGLYDYWQLMGHNDRCAGGFLWALFDEGVVRTDRDGTIDTKECFGPDGIVGPHHEREASYYTIRQIWSPVQVLSAGNGNVKLENCYDFTNLNTCRLHFRYLQLPQTGGHKTLTLSSGSEACPDAAPHDTASAIIAPPPADADVLELTVTDRHGDSLFTITHDLGYRAVQTALPATDVAVRRSNDTLTVESNGRTYIFSRADGLLKGVNIGKRKISIANGPKMMAARRSDRPLDRKVKLDRKKALGTTDYTLYTDSATVKSISTDGATLTISYKGGYMKSAKWTFMDDGSVRLASRYRFEGVTDLLGVMFDYPETAVTSKRWVGKGPFRVWQNRTHGPQYGYWHNEYNDPVPGETFIYPEFKGYFADVAWMQIASTEGVISLTDPPAESYVGVYQPRDGRDNYLYKLPESGISIMKYIPAVRNKVDYSDLNGPSAQPHWCDGEFEGEVTLKFE